MIITRTPFRISFFGGGTDYPAWYREHGGAVISTSINQYSFLVLRYLPDIFEYKYRVRYYEREETLSIDEIRHPVVREALKSMKFQGGLDITHHGDLPARSGVGSSSSFTVGLLHGLKALNNQLVTKRELALNAIDLEQNVLHDAVGSQDQVAAAFGGLNRIDFGGNSEFYCRPLTLSKSRLYELESWVQLIFTNTVRNSAEFAEKKIANINGGKSDLTGMQDLVDEAERSLFSTGESAIHDFAILLNEQWKLKKSFDRSASNPELESIYHRGISAGALGGKLLGAGGGGFMLFLTPPEKQEAVVKAVGLPVIPIRFDFLGSQIIYHSHE